MVQLLSNTLVNRRSHWFDHFLEKCVLKKKLLELLTDYEHIPVISTTDKR